jgi:hypothetical protein
MLEKRKRPKVKTRIICSAVALLGVAILAAALYRVYVDGSNRQTDALFAAGTLCLFAALPGAIVSASKRQILLFYGLIIAGVVILGIGIILLINLELQDVDYGHAIPLLELLVVGLIGMLVAATIIRYGRYFTSYFVIAAIGMLAVCIGLYLLVSMNYHERAYIALGTGGICLLTALIGSFVFPKRTHQFKS